MQIEIGVNNQQLIYKNRRNFIVSDSIKYLHCNFEFSEDWNNCEKTAVFETKGGDAFSVLLVDNQCVVPYEVLKNDFYISAFGVEGDKRITTNPVLINVHKSGYKEGITPEEPTPTVYDQILKRVSESETALSKEIQKVTTDLNNNIDTHTTDTDIHITADERTLWNTVSDKAEQSDVDEIRNEMSGLDVNITAHSSDEEMHITYDERVLWNNNVEKTKQNQEAILNIEGHIDTLYDDTHVNKGNIEALQTQIGDIATILADIKADQEALINGGEE